MQNQLPSSVQTVMSIDDLLMEILLHLPARSIILFKMVSKYWYSVITSPGFSLRHTRKPTAVAGILFRHCDFLSNGSYEFAPLSIENPATPPFRQLKITDNPSLAIKIKQACNGLLFGRCIRLKPYSKVYESFLGTERYYSNQYFVCNPTTKRFVTLPAQEIGSPPSWICGMSLAFDPAKSPHYKVVCVCQLKNSSLHPYVVTQFQMEVYSSETHSWRLSGEAFTAKLDFGGHGVYWNGAIHWICNGYKDLLFYIVDVETLHMMPMPPLTPWPWRGTRRLVESCDHLYLIEAEEEEEEEEDTCSAAYLRFYEMKSDRSEWFVKYRVDLSPLIESYGKVSLLALVRNKEEEEEEEEDDAYLFLGTVGEVVRYHLLKNTCEVCCVFDVGDKKEAGDRYFPYYPKFNGLQFMESLCSV